MPTKQILREVRAEVLRILGDGQPHEHEEVLEAITVTTVPQARDIIRTMIADGYIHLTKDWKLKKAVYAVWDAPALKDPILASLDLSKLAPITEESRARAKERAAAIEKRLEEQLKPYRRVYARKCRHCGRRDP